MAQPLISVIICTHNRVSLLRGAIESVTSQDYDADGYEVIVVDNASTDHTREMIESFSETANVRYVYESRLGLNLARNTGWRSASGIYVVFLDDDAQAQPGWLAAIRDGFAAAGGQAVIGGKVDPIWESEQPDWLSDELVTALTIVDLGSHSRPLAKVPKEWLAGANMALPVTMLKDLGGFDPRLDRRGDLLLSNGDIHIQRKAQKLGYPCIYIPQMCIRHLAPSSRLNQDWFKTRFYRQGVSDAYMYRIENMPTVVWRLREVVRRTCSLLNVRKLRALVSTTSMPDEFTRNCLVLMEIGYLVGLIRFDSKI